uniref:BAAT/Acyl-CoA thioester hydrolase C-terminal domain-containing protein n=1 Tax=Nothobranchius furzeri TaxID=105023 RepID=A0A1A7ZLN4_NOTFU
MFRARVSVTAIQLLINMEMKPCLSFYSKLPSLQQLSVRWKSGVRPAPFLTATPVRALIDEQISIRGSFLPPHSPITLSARMHSDEGDLWESFAHFNTSASGTFSSTNDHSVGGSYLGCPGPFPAMLDLWGMGGGLQEYRASLLASKGFASLSLAYIGHKDLPGPPNRVNVGDSYFKAAFQLLQDHPQVISDRVGIIGLSFGCYVTLRIATRTGVKPACLVCINGPVGSTVTLSDSEGRTEIFDSYQKYWTYDDQGYVIFKEVSLPANLPPDSIVELEKLDCPLMYIVGEDDLSASSIENADMIEETLRSAGKPHLFTRLSYPGAGHLIEPPYSPNARASLWSVKPKKLITLWGGHPAPHAAAQEDAWEKVLNFLNANLRR